MVNKNIGCRLLNGPALHLKPLAIVRRCCLNVDVSVFWVLGKHFRFVRGWVRRGLGRGRAMAVHVKSVVVALSLPILALVNGLRLLRERSGRRRRIVDIPRWRVGRGRFYRSYTPVEPNPP